MIVFNAVFSRNDNDINTSHYLTSKIATKFGAERWGGEVYDSSGSNGDHIDHCVLVIENITAVGDIDLHNKFELAPKLELQVDDADINFVAAAFLKWREGCLNYLKGDFVFAIWDNLNNDIFLGRAPLGQKALFYYWHDDLLLLSNSIHFFSTLKASSQLNDVWIANYLQRNYNCNRADTVYQHVKRLEPGHHLLISDEGSTLFKYWDIRHQTCGLQIKSPSATVDELRYLISSSVSTRLRGENRDGVELSGGLDSSVAALFAQEHLVKSGFSLTAFSNVLPISHKGFFHNFDDEWEKSSAVAAHLGIKKHIGVDNIVTPMLQLIEKSVNVIGYPTRLFLSLAQEGVFYAAKANGVTNLISGYGGDQMVTTEGYIRLIRHLISKNKIVSAVNFSAKQSGSLLKALVFVGNKMRLAALGTQQKKIEFRLRKSLLKSSWLDDHRLKQFATLYLFENQNVRDYTYDAIHSSIFLERLETEHLMAEQYGIKYQYPLIDTRLIEYFFHLPDEWKASHIFGRALIREVIKDRLPTQIVQQRKVGNVAIATVPFGKVLRQENFNVLKDWCLSFSQQHEIYNFIDRSKLINLTYNNEKDGFDSYRYDYLLCTASMIMFMEKTKSHTSNALLQN